MPTDNSVFDFLGTQKLIINICLPAHFQLLAYINYMNMYFSFGLSTLGLDRPVVSPDLSRRETAGSTSLLLDVERNTSASPADGVRLVAPLSKGAGSLGHLGASHHYSLVEVNQAIKVSSTCWSILSTSGRPT